MQTLEAPCIETGAHETQKDLSLDLKQATINDSEVFVSKQYDLPFPGEKLFLRVCTSVGQLSLLSFSPTLSDWCRLLERAFHQ